MHFARVFQSLKGSAANGSETQKKMRLYTYTATASVVCHVGATPVMIDSTEKSVEMDYYNMAEAITERTKFVIAVDLGEIGRAHV